MQVIDTILEGVKIIAPKVFLDDRGYFFESFNDKEFREKVCDTTFVQDNQSKSCKGTLRGLHWQAPPFAQSKLVRVTKGAVIDVAVDVRVGSPTFGKHVAVRLSDENNFQLFIPRGFAHGFIALTDNVIFQYKCDNLYNKKSERAVRWDSINWDLEEYNIETPILSDKDKVHKLLSEMNENELFNINDKLYE
jgi:dTDP-4-dehydrorhamnose 3,5-epimerase